MENLEIIEQLIKTVDVYVFSKDKHGKYLFSNDHFVEAAGLDSKEQIVGLKDSDLVWKDQYDYFKAGDISAMTGCSKCKKMHNY